MAYNGWTNYETWNVALWFGNEEGLYWSLCAECDVLREDGCGGCWTADSARVFVLAMLPFGTPDFDGPSAYDSVNWDEIASSWNEDWDLSEPPEAMAG